MKLLAVLFFFLSMTSPASAAPLIEFSQTRADLGFVSSGDTVEHTFEFTNAGDEELIIHAVTTN